MMHYRSCGFIRTYSDKMSCAQWQFNNNIKTDVRRNLGTFTVPSYGPNSINVDDYAITDTNFFVVKGVNVAIDTVTIDKYAELVYGVDGTTESTYCPTCQPPNTQRVSWFRVLVDYTHLPFSYQYKFRSTYPIHNTYNINAKVKEKTSISITQSINVIPIVYNIQFQCKSNQAKTFQKLNCYGQIMSETADVKMTVKTYNSLGALYSSDVGLDHNADHRVKYGYDVPNSKQTRYFPAKNFVGLDEEVIMSYGVLKQIELFATRNGTLDFTVF
jgi:hypothetical protein